MATELVQDQVRNLPASPGVYLMKDAGGTIIYVGKATSLKDRVRSYFAEEPLDPKTEKLVARIRDIEYIVTATEHEALILEMNLIKQHHPRYNVRLKDDKAFPYLKISLNEDYPRVCITRRWEQDGARYFGPFTSAWSVRQTLKLLRRLFPARSCNKPLSGHEPCPCLEYHIKNCLGPCIGAISKEEYREIIRQIVLFLEGKQEAIVANLRREMEEASEALDFEKAALVRDQVRALESVIEGQKLAARVQGEQDIIAFATQNDQACVQVFFVRRDRIIGRESFIMQGVSSETPARVITSFVQQYYDSRPNVPERLLLQYPLEDAEIMKKWLAERRGSAVEIQVPQRGNRKALVDVVAENACHGLEQLRVKQQTGTALAEAMANIERELDLEHAPDRIEGYDISNIQGTSAVGSLVVFENGKPKPADYRRFRIKTVTGADDYAMMQEVLRRRFSKVSEAGVTESWSELPDLVLIDGGKGQLNAVMEVMRGLGLESLSVMGLAKENEEIFLPGREDPIVLPRSSPGLHLLQRVRDEAHRFAVAYFQKVHKKRTFASALDQISGIGPGRKRSLLRKFGSLKAIRSASEAELIAAGLPSNLARKLKAELERRGQDNSSTAV